MLFLWIYSAGCIAALLRTIIGLIIEYKVRQSYNRCLELLEYLIAVLNELDETDNRDKFVEDVGEDLALAILEYEMCKQVFANAVREGYENE